MTAVPARSGWWHRAVRSDARLFFLPVGVVVVLSLSMLRLGTELERAARTRAIHREQAAQRVRDDTELRQALNDEDRDYGSAHIEAERRLVARLIRPSMKVVQFTVGGDGSLGLTVLGRSHSVFFFANDPDDFGEFKTTAAIRGRAPLQASDIDPQAPLRVVHGAEALSPDGRSMNIDTLTLGENPDGSGRLIWTLVADADPPATYYASRTGIQVATSRSGL